MLCQGSAHLLCAARARMLERTGCCSCIRHAAGAGSRGGGSCARGGRRARQEECAHGFSSIAGMQYSGTCSCLAACTCCHCLSVLWYP
jgi:hypothetical protein